jgi:hypothetical protein
MVNGLHQTGLITHISGHKKIVHKHVDTRRVVDTCVYSLSFPQFLQFEPDKI